MITNPALSAASSSTGSTSIETKDFLRDVELLAFMENYGGKEAFLKLELDQVFTLVEPSIREMIAQKPTAQQLSYEQALKISTYQRTILRNRPLRAIVIEQLTLSKFLHLSREEYIKLLSAQELILKRQLTSAEAMAFLTNDHIFMSISLEGINFVLSHLDIKQFLNFKFHQFMMATTPSIQNIIAAKGVSPSSRQLTFQQAINLTDYQHSVLGNEKMLNIVLSKLTIPMFLGLSENECKDLLSSGGGSAGPVATSKTNQTTTRENPESGQLRSGASSSGPSATTSHVSVAGLIERFSIQKPTPGAGSSSSATQTPASSTVTSTSTLFKPAAPTQAASTAVSKVPTGKFCM